MAGLSNVNTVSRAVVAAAVALMLAVAVRAARPVELKDSNCSTADTYVYPFCSLCDSPAETSTGYHFVTPIFDMGGLEPAYEESNSTYYVRLTGSSKISLGATYAAVAASGESGTLLVNSPVYMYNVESKRALQWRKEGDLYFLIEQEVSSVTEGAVFRVVQPSQVFPWAAIASVVQQCQTYFLISDPDSSTGYTDAAMITYIKGSVPVAYVVAAPAGIIGYLQFTILQTNSSTAASSAMTLPTIRTLTQL